MTRLVQRQATRGSQRWLQQMAGSDASPLSRALATAIGARCIRWVSPLASDEYAEYRDGSFLEKLAVRPTRVDLADYWPRRGPVWDGLAVSDTGVRVLVEAKAHRGEMVSAMGAGPASAAWIKGTLEATATALGTALTPAWTERYYQYANRLAHLRFLRHLNGIDCVLAFVYFAGDFDIGGPLSPEAWSSALADAKNATGLPEVIDGVVEVMVPVA